MKVKKVVRDYTYKLEIAKLSPIILIVEDAEEYQLLNIIADPIRYFNIVSIDKPIFPKIELLQSGKVKVLTIARMKKLYKQILQADVYYFSIQSETYLNALFKLKPVIKTLSARGWHKEHNNYNKAEKWERTPAKRKTPARNVVKAKKAVKAKKK
jgi:hypothetical protein